MINKFIENYKDSIIKNTQELINIPSVNSPSENSCKPFGENVAKALEYMLNLGQKLGFRTKNVDGYCGYIEFGEGEELVGIIGHLDVVPEGDGWTFPPFSGTISKNKIFGRGAIDDKGPVISSLYAMKIVKDNFKINKRVRLILGLNEEMDWKCINYYKEHEELPTIGFSPDADFPCIYAEKSILSCYLKSDISFLNKESIQITEIDCNNNAINVVPKICSVILKINSLKIDIINFIKTLKNIIDSFEYEIDIYQIDNEFIKLTSHGIPSHAAHPDLGLNAISRLLIVLKHLFNNYDINLEILDFFNKYINFEIYGKSLGINFEDESGKLTLNVGNLKLDNGIIKIGMNLRIPVNTDISVVQNKFKELTNLSANINFETTAYQPYLYIPKDNYLVQTLCNIYNEETNSNLEPIAIGGGTYARAFDNCISFGANFPGNKDMCHQTDEFLDIDALLLSCRIYAKAIIELGK